MILEINTEERILEGDVYADPVFYTHYDHSFDAFNHRVGEEIGIEVKQPRQEKPLSVKIGKSLQLELWIANREAMLLNASL
ncbi:MAG TPA: hypothetical protein PLW64_00585 [Niabella sp.]|nr:hypothetical protein [Niabella sp.]